MHQNDIVDITLVFLLLTLNIQKINLVLRFLILNMHLFERNYNQNIHTNFETEHSRIPF